VGGDAPDAWAHREGHFDDLVECRLVSGGGKRAVVAIAVDRLEGIARTENAAPLRPEEGLPIRFLGCAVDIELGDDALQLVSVAFLEDSQQPPLLARTLALYPAELPHTGPEPLYAWMRSDRQPADAGVGLSEHARRPETSGGDEPEKVAPPCMSGKEHSEG
jgi:hypothetical protein